MTAAVHTDVPGMPPGLFPQLPRPASLTDLRMQVRSTMDNLIAVLQATGSSSDQVVERSPRSPSPAALLKPPPCRG